LPGNAYLLEVEPGTEELAFVAAFLDEGLRQRNFCGVILFDIPHENMIRKLADFGVDVREALDSGSMIIADLWSEGKYDPESQGPILMTGNLGDPNSVLRIYNDLGDIGEKRMKSGRYTGSRLVVFSISSQIMNYKFETTYRLTKICVNMTRLGNVPSLRVINPRMFDETVVAAFEHLTDGAIVLTMKENNGRFQRFIRIKQSPITGFRTDEVPYDIMNNKPHLLTALAESKTALESRLKLQL
jgi:KaiC/GvpD/RAD55 family RecA-like ATPase